MSEEPKRDWFKTLIHSAFGFVIGGCAGFYYGENIIWAIVGGVVLGLIAAIYLDDFWDSGWWLWP